jgi:hypothetical protein
MIANLHLANSHRERLRSRPAPELVIRVRDVNVRPEHIAIADLHIPTSVDHQVAIKVIVTPDCDPDSFERNIDRPEPASLRKRIEFADPDLRQPPTPSLSLHSVPPSHLHAKKAVEKEPHAAGRPTRHSKAQLFETHGH